MEVYADEETKSFVRSVKEGDAVTVSLVELSSRCSAMGGEELHFIWCIAGEPCGSAMKTKRLWRARWTS